MIKEYKPILLFLAKFLGLYMALNLLYGFWIESFGNRADTATYLVTEQTVFVLDWFYDNLNFDYYLDTAKIWMGINGDTVINIFEGCNGINVLVLYMAFIVAYRGNLKDTILFVLIGIFLIHVSNILRLVLLFFVAESYPQYLYFSHKYLFTASIYAIVFILWFVWVRRVNKSRGNE